MNRFAVARPSSFEQAGALASDGRYALPVLKAGGMDVLDHLKEGLLEPDLLIDIRRLRSADAKEMISRSSNPGHLRLEAMTTLAEIAASSLLQDQAPVVAQAVSSAATPQVRNVATAAGNLLQRPRCWYYRSSQFDCLKKGGHNCYAFDGENRYHAIYGEGPCYIVHPSNLAPALYVLEAAAHLTGGQRDSIRISDLYHMPDRGIRTEHDLEPGEIVTHLTFRAAPKSAFYAVKEKQSFDWPLVMAAAALRLEGNRIESARICAGAVAPVPWPLPAVERALAGVRVDDDEALAAACANVHEGARPLAQNAYKLSLLPVAIRRAVLRAAGREVEALT